MANIEFGANLSKLTISGKHEYVFAKIAVDRRNSVRPRRRLSKLAKNVKGRALREHAAPLRPEHVLAEDIFPQLAREAAPGLPAAEGSPGLTPSPADREALPALSPAPRS